MRDRYIPYMNWVDVKEKIDSGVGTVILPMGATEQHGRHAPLGTDSFIALEMSMRVARIINSLVAPPLTIGYSPQHMSFSGSMTLSVDTFRRLVTEMVESLMKHGLKKFIFLSAHGGNSSPSDITAKDLKHKYGEELQLMVVDMIGIQNSLDLKEKVEQELGETFSDPCGSHAGEQESSAVMFYKEDLINKERIGVPFIPEEYLKISRDPDVHTIIFNLSKYTDSGTWGDATNASSEQGDIFYRLLSEKLADKIKLGWETT